MCTFQPGNFTGCGSEGVKIDFGQAERLVNHNAWPWDKMSL